MMDNVSGSDLLALLALLVGFYMGFCWAVTPDGEAVEVKRGGRRHG